MSVVLSEHLPLLASAPDGIKKLRWLILELAVRGKLVPQDPKDEPATELVKRASSEAAARKMKLQLPLEEDKQPFSVPASWKWVRFGSIAQHNSGKTLDKGRNAGRARDYITTSNLYWGRFELTNVRQMLIRDDELEKCTARKNDLLICEGGEAGRAAVWALDQEICFQNHIHRARLFADINPYFAFRMFEKLNASGEINQYRQGVGISNMSGKTLAAIPFPLPPLAEQCRIVAKVDELMALCDRFEAEQSDAETAHARLVETLLGTLSQSADAHELAANWQRLVLHFETLFTTEASLNALKRAILQFAVMGKLVPQDPNDESASQLLGHIRLEKGNIFATNKIKRNKPTTVISDDLKPFELPVSWEWTQLQQLAVSGPSNGYSPKPSPNETPFRCLTLSATTQGYFKPDCFKFVDITEAVARQFYLKKGDLLIQRGNSLDYVGMAAIYDGEDDQFIYPDLMMRIQQTKQFDAQFLHSWLISSYGRDYFMRYATGTQGTMPKVNQGTVAGAPIPVPPLAEQQRIVAKVAELLALCDRLKVDLVDSRSHQARLADTLIDAALEAA